MATKYSPGDIIRRSSNSKPSIWNFDFVQSIKINYSERNQYANEVKTLKDKVRIMLNEVTDPLFQLEQIDMLQRFGLSHHFEDEIKGILKGLYSNDIYGNLREDNLHAMALKFRLLRQYRFNIPQEVFQIFKDEKGNFKECLSDVVGLLSLYEASFHLVKGEVILKEAREFSTKHLQKFLKNNKDESYISKLVGHALEVPLHWRAPRLEARWFIDLCKTRHDLECSTLLELAILDFNYVQSIHQEELKDLSRWWKQLDIGEKMKFSRDRLPEHFLWAMGMVHEPQLAYCRKMVTKIFAILTIIDDVYDVFGTLEELELFTDAFERWDVNNINELPEYMKICFLAVYNFTNEVVYYVLKEQGILILKYLRNVLVDLSKGFLLEAKWYYCGYTPSFQEYIDNAWVSITGPTCLVLVYFLVTNPVIKETLEILEKYPSIIRQSSLICRLANDLSTSHFEVQRGDATPSSIQCYMEETGSSEEKAREHLKLCIDEAWKQMNEDRVTNSPFSHTFFELACVNLARMTMWMYHNRDGFGAENNCVTKETALLVLINPIPHVRTSLDA